MKRFFFGTKNIIIPGSWNKLTKNDLLYFSKLFNNKLTKKEIIINLFRYFSKISFDEMQNIKPSIYSSFELQLDFLFENIKLTKQLLPIIKLNFKKWKGAKEGLTDWSFERFIIFSETYFESYIKHGDTDNLDMLIATIYLPKNQKFNAENIKENAKKLHSFSDEYKTAILFFYQGNRSMIANYFPKLFVANKNGTNNNMFSFLDVIETLNNGDVSKNNEIRNINIYDVFTRLQNKLTDKTNNI